MKRYVKIAISAAFLVILMLGRLLAWPFRTRRSPPLTILYYHAVPRTQAAQFARQMRLLAAFARVVPADWRGEGPRHWCTVAITFDDAFDSALDNALPILAQHRFHCTIFVPAGHIGKPPSWDMESSADRQESVAGASRLRDLPGELVTLGSHTVTHPRLTSLPDEAVCRELVQSRKDLLEITGQDATLLAFPYGDHDARVVELCRASGYRCVFTISPSPVYPDEGSFTRGRVSVEPGDGILEFFLKAVGAYAWMAPFSKAKRRLLRTSGGSQRLDVAHP